MNVLESSALPTNLFKGIMRGEEIALELRYGSSIGAYVITPITPSPSLVSPFILHILIQPLTLSSSLSPLSNPLITLRSHL